MESYLLHEYRCDGCGKLIIKGMLLKSYEEFKCARCGKIVRFNGIANEDRSDRYFLLVKDNGIVVNASPSIQNNLGFVVSDIVGKNIGDLYSREEERKADKIFSDKIAKLKYLRWDTNHKSKDGNEIPVTICFRSFQKDGHDYVLRIVDRQSGINKVLETQSTFDSKNYSDFVGEVNLEGRVVYIDDRAEKIIGFTPEEIIGRHLSEFLVPEEVSWRNKNMAMLFTERQSYKIPSLKLVHKNGSIVDCECFSSPVYDDLGEFVGYRDLCWIRH